MKPEIYIDGVPAADVARRAITLGLWKLPRPGALHPPTPEGRAQMRADTDHAALQLLKEEREAAAAAKSKEPA